MSNQQPVSTDGIKSKSRYYDHTAYLARQEPREVVKTVEIDPSTGYTVQQAFNSHDGAQERTSGQDRAKGLIIRLVPLSIFILILTIGVGVLIVALTDLNTIWAVIWGAIVFAGMGLLTYNRESLRDYQFSRAGLERHRVDKAADLKMQELEYQYRLKQMLLKYHLDTLETIERDDHPA